MPLFAAPPSPPALVQKATRNPSSDEIAAAFAEAARKERVPVVLLNGLAWQASGWRQVDGDGKTIESVPGRVGILGVPTEKRTDADRLRSDWRYNIAQGANRLALAFFRSPIIGNGSLDDGRDILESWFYALGRYGTGKNGGPVSAAFANAVLDAVASGGANRWSPVNVSRPHAEQTADGNHIFGPPTPWHFAGIIPRPPAQPVVDLSAPYLSQVWDTPDDFRGGGSCGPTSMLMALIYLKKLGPNPVSIADSYVHVSEYGGHVPLIEAKVCDPELGAIHARMLDYLRPYFPEVAIYYDEKATYARVKKALDAGQPVILGTEVTSAGHLMLARGYLTDGRLIVNDPAGDYYQAARTRSPFSGWSESGRYFNGGGNHALYDWDALAVRWVMTLGPKSADADKAEDESLK